MMEGRKGTVRQDPLRARGPGIASTVAWAAVLALLMLTTLAGPVLAEGDEGNLPRYWEVHAALLSLATGLFVLSYGALVVKFLRANIPELKALKVRWLARAHVVLGAAGAALGVAGMAVGLYMVEMAGTGHARLLHSLVGLTTLACVILPVATGLAVNKVRERKAQARWWHIAVGFVGIVVMLAGAVTGWALE